MEHLSEGVHRGQPLGRRAAQPIGKITLRGGGVFEVMFAH
jgi:hypothetical protein